MHTGSRAFCILMALAAAGAETASVSAAETSCQTSGVQPGFYRVESILISVPPTTAKEIANKAGEVHYSNSTVANFIRSHQANVLTSPSVVAQETSRAMVGVTRNAPFPHGATHEVGIKITVTPDTKSPQPQYHLNVQTVSFGGFADAKAFHPIFNVQRLNTLITKYNPSTEGYDCFALPVCDKVAATYDADGRQSASIADANERQLLFVKITRG